MLQKLILSHLAAVWLFYLHECFPSNPWTVQYHELFNINIKWVMSCICATVWSAIKTMFVDWYIVRFNLHVAYMQNNEPETLQLIHRKYIANVVSRAEDTGELKIQYWRMELASRNSGVRKEEKAVSCFERPRLCSRFRRARRSKQVGKAEVEKRGRQICGLQVRNWEQNHKFSSWALLPGWSGMDWRANPRSYTAGTQMYTHTCKKSAQ